jgi:hypothetical protein
MTLQTIEVRPKVSKNTTIVFQIKILVKNLGGFKNLGGLGRKHFNQEKFLFLTELSRNYKHSFPKLETLFLFLDYGWQSI